MWMSALGVHRYTSGLCCLCGDSRTVTVGWWLDCSPVYWGVKTRSCLTYNFKIIQIYCGDVTLGVCIHSCVNVIMYCSYCSPLAPTPQPITSQTERLDSLRTNHVSPNSRRLFSIVCALHMFKGAQCISVTPSMSSLSSC